MKNIVLQRRIAVQCWNVLGTVAKASKRPELMPILLRARERNQTSAEDIAEHLFFEQRSRRVVAERLLRIAASYGLLAQKERWFMLTDAGVAALDSAQVFVPEHGSWTIWASDDPLLDYPVLRVEAWREPTAFDDVQNRKSKDSDMRKFVNVPSLLRKAVGRIAAPPGAGGMRVRVDDLNDKAEIAAPMDEMRFVWRVGEKAIRLTGSLGDQSVSTVLDAPGLAQDDAWRQLLQAQGLWSRWDRAQGALLVDFNETKDSERESMRRDMEFNAPALDGFGTFDPLTIQDVPLHARTAHDAEQWATWRLQSRLRDYATRERFNAWTQEATEPFASHGISVPSRSQLAKAAWAERGDRPTPIVWHLAAAEDWSL